MHDLQVEPTPKLSWAVGDRVRDIYQFITGELPVKDLRPKTNSGGSHCFAIYPEWMVPVIAHVIKQQETEIARQGSFDFFGDVAPKQQGGML